MQARGFRSCRSMRAAACVHKQHTMHAGSPSRSCAGADGQQRVSRRILGSFLTALLCTPKSVKSLTLEDVTPRVFPTPRLTQREKELVDIYNRSTFSTVSVTDITIPVRQGAIPEADVPAGNGSGIVWDEKGHIVTNFHVLGSVLKGLDPASQEAFTSMPQKVARVTLLSKDGARQRTYDGVLVGADKSSDLAVVRIDAPPEQLQPITIGRSASLRVGQLVYAIGCPFGFDHTLTTGVVSGLNREVVSALGSIIPGAIQTDASINPGNSGGPLLDSSGCLVGLNCAILTTTGTSAGVGFAIPGDTVTRTVPQLISMGRLARPSLGLLIASPLGAERLGITSGALVQSLVPGGAAQKAGVLPMRRNRSGLIIGDVVTKIDDKPIEAPSDIRRALDDLSVGQSVRLTVLRASNDNSQREITLEAELEAASD